jgi:hypothetical protein
MHSNHFAAGFHRTPATKLDRTSLDGAAQLREAIHDLLRETKQKLAKIETDHTLTTDQMIRKRLDVANASLSKLTDMTQWKLTAIEGRLSFLREKRRSLRARGGEPHPALAREELELASAVNLCRQALQNAREAMTSGPLIRTC